MELGELGCLEQRGAECMITLRFGLVRGWHLDCLIFRKRGRDDTEGNQIIVNKVQSVEVG